MRIFLFSVWSQNPEFTHHHSDYHPSVLAPPFTPVTPSAPSVWLGGLTLHPVYPGSSDPSTHKSPSPFSGTRLAFCPQNYGPRSRCQGRNSKPCPIIHPSVLPLASSPDLPHPCPPPVPSRLCPPPVPSRPCSPPVRSAPGPPVPRLVLPTSGPAVPRPVCPTPGLPVCPAPGLPVRPAPGLPVHPALGLPVRPALGLPVPRPVHPAPGPPVLPAPGPPVPRPVCPAPGLPVPWPVRPAPGPLGGAVVSASLLGGAVVSTSPLGGAVVYASLLGGAVVSARPLGVRWSPQACWVWRFFVTVLLSIFTWVVAATLLSDCACGGDTWVATTGLSSSPETFLSSS